MTEFYIGQIFENEYPIEAACWCNEHGGCHIIETENTNGVQKFQIKEIPPLSEEDLKQIEIKKIKTQLEEIDLKSIRAIRAGETEYISQYEEQAQALRTKLSDIM